MSVVQVMLGSKVLLDLLTKVCFSTNLISRVFNLI